MKFWIFFPTWIEGVDPENDNLDTNVVLENGEVYFVCFFTLANVQRLMDDKENGLPYNYFWATDMVMIRKLTVEMIAETVANLIRTSYLEDAGSKIGTIETVYGKMPEDERLFEFELAAGR